MTRIVGAILVAFAIAAGASCDGTEDTAATTGAPPTAPASTSTTARPATTSTPTPPTATTVPVATTTSATPPTVPPATATTPTTATPPTSEPAPACDRADAIRLLDDALELARLAPGTAWTDDTAGVAFDARTDTAEVWASLQGFDCGLRLAQRTDAGAERLALAAWNDRRDALVIQATDAPTEPYAADAVFQLFIEQPYGEFLTDREVWAATMSGGESIVLAAHDTSIGWAAKSWQAEVPPFEDLPVTLDAERYGIDVLRAAGARNVSVAEPNPAGWDVGSLQLHTPWVLTAFAAVGVADTFDPSVPIVADGDTTFHEVAGVEVRVTTGEELPGIVLHEAGWRCDGHSWRLMSGDGSPAEILEFAGEIIRTACA